MGDRTAFFYGTLMAPAVLHRVCHGPANPTYSSPSTSYLSAQPALLRGHQRHRVRHADYPAILPHTSSTVRGTYVTGLTENDIWRLDIFEGDEYKREKVSVRLLPTSETDSNGVGAEASDKDRLTDEAFAAGKEVQAETYIWIGGAHRLEDQEWDFEAFKKEKMRFWVGGDTSEYVDVDQAVEAQEQQQQQGSVDGTGGRGLNGHIGEALRAEQEKPKEDPLKSAV